MFQTTFFANSEIHFHLLGFLIPDEKTSRQYLSACKDSHEGTNTYRRIYLSALGPEMRERLLTQLAIGVFNSELVNEKFLNYCSNLFKFINEENDCKLEHKLIAAAIIWMIDKKTPDEQKKQLSKIQMETVHKKLILFLRAAFYFKFCLSFSWLILLNEVAGNISDCTEIQKQIKNHECSFRESRLNENKAGINALSSFEMKICALALSRRVDLVNEIVTVINSLPHLEIYEALEDSLHKNIELIVAFTELLDKDGIKNFLPSLHRFLTCDEIAKRCAAFAVYEIIRKKNAYHIADIEELCALHEGLLRLRHLYGHLNYGKMTLEQLISDVERQLKLLMPHFMARELAYATTEQFEGILKLLEGKTNDQKQGLAQIITTILTEEQVMQLANVLIDLLAGPTRLQTPPVMINHTILHLWRRISENHQIQFLINLYNNKKYNFYSVEEYHFCSSESRQNVCYIALDKVVAYMKPEHASVIYQQFISKEFSVSILLDLISVNELLPPDQLIKVLKSAIDSLNKKISKDAETNITFARFIFKYWHQLSEEQTGLPSEEIFYIPYQTGNYPITNRVINPTQRATLLTELNQLSTPARSGHQLPLFIKMISRYGRELYADNKTDIAARLIMILKKKIQEPTGHCVLSELINAIIA